MKLEEAVEILQKWVDDDRRMRNGEVQSDFDEFCEERNIAIETVLKNLK